MHDGSALILLVALNGEGAVAGLVHRGLTADIALARDGDVGIGIHDDGRLRCGFRQGNGLVVQRIDKPFALAIALECLHVDDVGLLRTGLDGKIRGVVRPLVTLIGTDAHDVGCSGA